MQEFQVNYLMSGSPHAPYLLASLYTLRFHYSGHVVVHAWPESFPLVELIAKDHRLNIEARKREPAYRGRNAQFLDKIKMIQSLKEEQVLHAAYIDADTTFHRPIDELIDASQAYEFLATQFNNWTVDRVKRRIRWVSEFTGKESIDSECLETVLNHLDWPSVNGGVWIATPTSEILQTWYDWTWVCRKKVFIADEVVLHVLLGKYLRDFRMGVWHGGQFNSSPIYKSLPPSEIAIMHYHGDSNVRTSKSRYGFKAWWPIWKTCVQRNIGNVRSWKDEANNKFIKALES